MPPRKQDPVEQHDARTDDPEAPKSERGSRAGSKKRKRRPRRARSESTTRSNGARSAPKKKPARIGSRAPKKGRAPAEDRAPVESRAPAESSRAPGESRTPAESSQAPGESRTPGDDRAPVERSRAPGKDRADRTPAGSRVPVDDPTPDEDTAAAESRAPTEDQPPPSPEGEDLASSQRRARVAAYTHPVNAPHSPRDLDAVADLALELAQLSTPETRSRLLAEAVAHAEAKEARYRVPMREPGAELRWKAPLALAIYAAAALAAVAPPGWAVPEPPARLDAGDTLHGIRVTLLLQAQQIEAFRTREQRLPDSLDQVAVRFAGVRFVRSSSRVYQLVGYTPGGEAVVYDAAQPGEDFERLGATWALTVEAAQ